MNVGADVAVRLGSIVIVEVAVKVAVGCWVAVPVAVGKSKAVSTGFIGPILHDPNSKVNTMKLVIMAIFLLIGMQTALLGQSVSYTRTAPT